MKSYIKGIVTFSLGTWLKAIINFAQISMITYLVSPEELGKAVMFSLLYNLGLVFSLFGLDEAFMRFYHEEENKSRLFWSCLYPSLMIGILLSSISIIFEKQMSRLLYGETYKWLGLLYAVTLISGVLQRYNQLYVRMKQDGVMFSILDVVNSGGNIIGMLAYIFLVQRSFFSLFFGQLCGNLLALMVGFIVDSNSRRFQAIEWKRLTPYFKYAIPLVPSALLFWLFSAIDRITLRQLSDFSEIGLYSVAFKIASIINLFNSGFINFWKPTVFDKYKNDPNWRNFLRRVFLIASAIIFTLTVGLLTVKDVVFMLFQRNYRTASFVLPALTLIPGMELLFNITGVGIFFSKKTYWFFFIAAVGVTANYFGNISLIPLLGARGAAISTGISYILIFALRTAISERLCSINLPLKKFVTNLTIAMCVILFDTFIMNYLYDFLFSASALFLLLIYNRAFLLNISKSIISLVNRNA
ncbi:oligosaccharide flippase family protein [Fervidobacterium gondwanense]|uniref:lipopolysaccharide biosynthesis protein n=1 Tax=Fervidobacterium gondwanense TaxID=44754 RepID=UPI003C71A481